MSVILLTQVQRKTFFGLVAPPPPNLHSSSGPPMSILPPSPIRTYLVVSAMVSTESGVTKMYKKVY